MWNVCEWLLSATTVIRSSGHVSLDPGVGVGGVCAVPSGGQTRSDTTDQSLANNSLGLEEMEILITLCLSSVCPQIVCPRGCTFTPVAFVPGGADV